MNIWDFEYSDR